MSAEAAAVGGGYVGLDLQRPQILERFRPVAAAAVVGVLALGGVMAYAAVDVMNNDGGDGGSSGHHSGSPSGGESDTSKHTDDPEVAKMPAVPCTDKFTPEVIKKLQADLLKEAKKGRYTPGGEVVVTCGQKIEIAFGFGKTRSGLGTPDPETTTYDIKSVTKSITGLTMLVLEDQGKLKLTDKASKYLPEFSKEYIAKHHAGQKGYSKKPQVTVGQLASYQAGFPDDGAQYTSLIGRTQNTDQLVHRLADMKLQYSPGKGTAYSNAGLLLAGVVNRKAAGDVLWKYQKANILKPAGVDADLYYPQAKNCAEKSCQTNDRLARRYGNYAGHDGARLAAVPFAKSVVFLMAGDGTTNGHRIAAPGLQKAMTIPANGNYCVGTRGNGGNYYGRVSDDGSPLMAGKYGDAGSEFSFDPVTSIGLVRFVDAPLTGKSKAVHRRMNEIIGKATGFITK